MSETKLPFSALRASVCACDGRKCCCGDLLNNSHHEMDYDVDLSDRSSVTFKILALLSLRTVHDFSVCEVKSLSV